MNSASEPREKACLAHTVFVLSTLLGDCICGVPDPNEPGHDEYLNALLDDVEQLRIASSRLIDLLRADYPPFALEYAAHEARMREASDRHEYARQLLKLAGDDPEGGAA